MVETMDELFIDYEELKRVHAVMSADYHNVVADKESLMSELKVLKEYEIESKRLLIENLDLKNRMKVLGAVVDDLTERNNSLTKIVDTYTKSKAAVETILSTQMSYNDQSGLGFDASSSSSTDTSVIEIQEEKAECSMTKSVHEDTKPKYNAVAMKYPKNQTKKKGKNKQKEIKVADSESADDSILGEYISRAAVAESKSSAADGQSPTKVVTKGKQVTKKSNISTLKFPKFVPADSPKSADELTKLTMLCRFQK